ncbi:MAG: dTDP-4-amino-4,6-dideoxygalactose transaminase [Anaerolineae bacterium]|nr:dTDP-4-amino-4,6-dideoxygalactose transaminase [Anaerolineae bacterium]
MDRSYRIPFNRPAQLGNEFNYIAEALANGHASGNGPFTKRCEALLEAALGATKVILTTSCTHALEMSALLLRIQPGDEVILPSFTFVSTANAFVLRGARPVFVDVRPDTCNLDERLVEAAITEKTRAIVPVHYAGVGCQMDVLGEIAARHNLPLVEDAAQGLFGRFRGQYLGTFGALGTISFHETKNFTCGEGGALVINDPALVERAEIISEKGTDRSRFFRGEVDKYTWVDVGSSYILSDILAAYLLAQLECRARVMQNRADIFRRYAQDLAGLETAGKVRLPIVPPDCEQTHHMFYMLLPSVEQRDGLIQHLKAHAILAVFHYVPLHTSSMGRRAGYTEADCPVTQSLSDRLVRLPFYNDLTKADQSRVIEQIWAFFR